MYLEQYGLNVNPFGLSHKLDFLFKSEAFQESMAHLIYGLDNREPVVMITGAIGTGKTMSLQSFLSNLGPSFSFALITNTRVTSVELLKLILEDLEVKFPLGCDKSDLLILFKEFLMQSDQDGRKVLVVVDEAQNLSREVLEEIRLLTNLGQGEGQPVQIILVGQPELEAIVNEPALAQLRQRIRVHYKLDPLTRQEMEEYVLHRMRVAGCDRRVFSPGALERIFALSGGVPRLVNTQAQEALLAAFVAGAKTVDPQHVEESLDLAPLELVPPVRPPATEASGPGPAPQPPPPPVQPAAPESGPPVMARHQSAGRRSRSGFWLVPTMLVLVLVALYFMGYLDELGRLEFMDRFREDQSADQVTAREQPADAGLTADAQGQNGSDTPSAEAETGNTAADTDREITVQEQVADPGTGLVDADALQGQVAEAEILLERYFIHISSFRSLERAESLVRRWEDVGSEVVYRKWRIGDTDWYRVYLGPFPSREEARSEADDLLSRGQIPYSRITQMDPAAGS